ncbi:hypothetical protein MPSI1_001551, partial [Malassezia psittaci]
MLKTVLTAIAAVATVGYAAPMEMEGTLECVKLKYDHELVGVEGNQVKIFGLEDSGKNGTMNIVETDVGNATIVTFYECKEAGSRYFANYPHDMQGQVRAENRPDYCLTADNVWQYTPDHKHDKNSSTPYPGTKNGTLTFQPCAERFGDTARLQWFDVENISEECGGRLRVIGGTDTKPGGDLVKEDGRWVLKPEAQVKNQTSMALFAGDYRALTKCQMKQKIDKRRLGGKNVGSV